MKLKTRIKHLLRNSRSPWVRMLYRKLRESKRRAHKRQSLHRISRGRSKLVTMDEAVAWTKKWARSLPSDTDLIIGIPRSGMLVASVIALKQVKPLATPDVFLDTGGFWRSGKMPPPQAVKKVLLVDDCVNSGKTMQRNARRLREARPGLEVITAALIAHDAAMDTVDLFYKNIPKPRFFEWDLMHQKKVDRLATDLDGVLCESCPPGVDRDEDRYLAWIEQAKPHMIPAYRIDVIVSNRLEAYRPQTEAWLARHRVDYGRLLLWDLPGKAEREGSMTRHKVEAIRRIRPQLFIESSYSQSERIWRQTGVPTLCTDEMVLFNGS